MDKYEKLAESFNSTGLVTADDWMNSYRGKK